MVTISHGGYAKTQPLSDYQAQRRGGMGKSATAVKDEDFVEHLLIASTHATILCFSNLGKVYWLKVYQIPLAASRNSRGRPMVNLLPLEEGERVTSILPVEDYPRGTSSSWRPPAARSRRPRWTDFSRQRSGRPARTRYWKRVTVLVGTAITSGECDVML